MNKRILKLMFLVMLFVTINDAAFGQSTTASISGAVVDEQ